MGQEKGVTKKAYERPIILNTIPPRKGGPPTIDEMRSYLYLVCLRACLKKYPSIHDTTKEPRK